MSSESGRGAMPRTSSSSGAYQGFFGLQERRFGELGDELENLRCMLVNLDDQGDIVTRAVSWAWNSSSIQLIIYFGHEGLVDPFNLNEKVEP
jgi:hypothetical protein